MTTAKLTQQTPNPPVAALDGLIIKDPTLRGGRPILAGTGVTVRTVAGHYKLGLNAEQIADRMELELIPVYAALTYYHLHKDEIEADILADSEEILRQKVGKWTRDSLDQTVSG